MIIAFVVINVLIVAIVRSMMIFSFMLGVWGPIRQKRTQPYVSS